MTEERIESGGGAALDGKKNEQFSPKGKSGGRNPQEEQKTSVVQLPIEKRQGKSCNVLERWGKERERSNQVDLKREKAVVPRGRKGVSLKKSQQ